MFLYQLGFQIPLHSRWFPAPNCWHLPPCRPGVEAQFRSAYVVGAGRKCEGRHTVCEIRQVRGDAQEPLPPSLADTGNHPALGLNAIAYAHPMYIVTLAHGTLPIPPDGFTSNAQMNAVHERIRTLLLLHTTLTAGTQWLMPMPPLPRPMVTVLSWFE